MLDNNNVIDNSTISDDLRLISDAAREAGNIAMMFFGHSPKVWYKDGNSPVSEADFAVDHYLKKKLLDNRPDYGWISEETSDERPSQNYQRFFVVDPIDGTRGFIEGKETWCVSIAIIENGRPICGVLHCPVTKEHFIAPLDGKAYNNDEIVSIGSDSSSHGLIACCASSWLPKIAAEYQQDFTFKSDVPSLAYRLALFACGKVDIVLVRPNAHDWDIAAADIIIQCAGGTFYDKDQQPIIYGNKPFSHSILIAASSKNFKTAIEIVNQVLKT